MASGAQRLGLLGGICASIGLIGLISWSCGASKVQAQVTRLRWHHRVELRERHLGHTGDWGSAPTYAGFFNEATFNEQCHQKANGRSCRRRDDHHHCTSWETDYRRWCDYDYWNWIFVDSLTTVGEGHVMTWTTFGPRLDMNHREAHLPTYTIDFENGQRTKRWEYHTSSEQRYRQFVIGDVWMLRLPNIGSMEPDSKSSLEKP